MTGCPLAALAAVILTGLTGLAGLAGCPSPTTRPDQPPAPPALTPATSSHDVTTLESGLRVTILPPRHRDTFAATLLIPVGPGDEPVALEGLTELTVAAATFATARDPDHQHGPHRRALELGGRLEPIHDGSLAGWRVSGPASSRGALLQLLCDVVSAPTFPSTRVQAFAERLREAREQEARPHARSRARAWAVGMALGLARPLATEAPDSTLARVHREDLARHHRHLFRPERALVVAEGAPVDVVAQGLRDCQRAPPPPPPPPSPCAAGSAQRMEQGWLAGPERDAALVVALEVPGGPHRLRPALEALLLELGARDGGAGPDVTRPDVVLPDVFLIDRGDRAVLVLATDDLAPPLGRSIDHWLATASRAAGPSQGDVGARLRLAHDPLARAVATARRALSLSRPLEAAPSAAVRAELSAIFSDVDRRVRVALGPERLGRALHRWGPVDDLTRRLGACRE